MKITIKVESCASTIKSTYYIENRIKEGIGFDDILSFRVYGDLCLEIAESINNVLHDINRLDDWYGSLYDDRAIVSFIQNVLLVNISRLNAFLHSHGYQPFFVNKVGGKLVELYKREF